MKPAGGDKSPRSAAASKAHCRALAETAIELFNRLGHVHGLVKTARSLLPALARLYVGANLGEVLANEKDLAACQLGLLRRCAALLRRRPAASDIQTASRPPWGDNSQLKNVARASRPWFNDAKLAKILMGETPMLQRQALLQRAAKSTTEGRIITAEGGCATGEVNAAGGLLDLLRLADELLRLGGGKVKLIPCDGPAGAELLARVKRQPEAQLHPPAWIDSLRVSTTTPHEPPPSAQRWAVLICQRQHQRFMARLPGMVSPDDEYVHELRVALRRLRSAVKVFSDVLPPPLVGMRGHLRTWARMLSPLRDDDIFIAFLQRYIGHHTGEEAPATLLGHIRRQRARRLVQARRFFSSPAFLRQSRQLGEILGHAQSPKESDSLAALAERQVNRHLAKAVKQSKDIRTLSETQLHQLRIRCKRLRYACEFFEPADAKRLGKLADAAQAMQDHIGEHRDAAVFLAKVREFQAAGRRSPAGRGSVRARQSPAGRAGSRQTTSGRGTIQDLDELVQTLQKQQSREFAKIARAWRELRRQGGRKCHVQLRVAQCWDLRQTSVI